MRGMVGPCGLEPQTSTVSRWAGLSQRFLLIESFIDLSSLSRNGRNRSKDKYGPTRYGSRYGYLNRLHKDHNRHLKTGLKIPTVQQDRESRRSATVGFTGVKQPRLQSCRYSQVWTFFAGLGTRSQKAKSEACGSVHRFS